MFQLWGADFLSSVYAWKPSLCLFWRRCGAEKGECGSEIWYLHILHPVLHCCAAKVALVLWRYMLNTSPTKVKARVFFANTEEAQDFSASGLGFQQILYWIICSKALAVLWAQEKICAASGAHNLSDTTTVDSRWYGFAFAYCYFYHLFLILAHLR